MADYAGACHRAALCADPVGSNPPTGYGFVPIAEVAAGHKVDASHSFSCPIAYRAMRYEPIHIWKSFIGYNYQRMSPIDALGVPGPQDPGRFSWVIRGSVRAPVGRKALLAG